MPVSANGMGAYGCVAYCFVPNEHISKKLTFRAWLAKVQWKSITGVDIHVNAWYNTGAVKLYPMNVKYHV